MTVSIGSLEAALAKCGHSDLATSIAGSAVIDPAVPSLIAIAKAALAYEAAKKSAAKSRAFWFYRGKVPGQAEDDRLAARALDDADREVACREAYYSALAQVTP